MHVRSIIGAKASTPEAANNLLKMLRVVLNFAVVEVGMIASNPALGGEALQETAARAITPGARPRSRNSRRGIRSAPRARLALALLLYTGQRRSDVVRMGWQHVKGDCIAVRQEKTDEPLLIPMDPPLAAALAVAAAHQHDVSDDRVRQAVRVGGFGNWFRERLQRGRTAGMLGAWPAQRGGRRLANAGCTEQDQPSPGIVANGRALHRSGVKEQLAGQALSGREGRARTKSTQHRNPSLPNSEKAMTVQTI